MRRLVALGIAGLSLFAGGSVSRPDASSAPLRFEAARGPLLGIVQQNDASELVRVHPRTLRPLPGRRLSLSGWSNWAFSPNRSRLVVAQHRESRRLPHASLRFADVRRLRSLASVPLGAGVTHNIAWLSPDRVLAVHDCCFGAFDLVVVSPRTGRVVLRRTVAGEPSARATRDELVLLVAPPQGIGTPRLLVADRRGEIRSASLDRIRAGREVPQEGAAPVSRHVHPGLTVDPDGRRAFVVSADGTFAVVDLRSLAISYHTPSAPRSLFGRLRDWLEPAAHAKASDGTSRQALWLGSGLVAVTGSDDHTFTGADGALSMRTEPAGLSLVDVESWTVQRIDESVSHVSRVGDLLLATGYSWDSSEQRQGGNGLAGYALDGSKRFHVFEGRNLTQLRIYSGRAYIGLQGTVRVGATYVRLDDGSAFKTIDLATGQVIGTRTASLPVLLTGD
jgi:hypothetical protein